MNSLLLCWQAVPAICISLWVLCRYEKLTARHSNASTANTAATGTAAAAITATAGTVAAAAASPSRGQQAYVPLAMPQENADHSIHAICRLDLLLVVARALHGCIMQLLYTVLPSSVVWRKRVSACSCKIVSSC